MPTKMKFIISLILGSVGFTLLFILGQIGILGGLFKLGFISLLGGGIFLVSFIIFSFIKKTTKEGLFLKKIYNGQQKINRLRSLTFRLQSDSIRKKGEKLTDISRDLFNIFKQKNDSNYEVEIEKFYNYFDKATTIMQTYITINKTNKEKGDEILKKIDSLFDIIIKVISQYMEGLTGNQLDELQKQINIAEKTAELDHYLQNNGIEIDDADLE